MSPHRSIRKTKKTKQSGIPTHLLLQLRAIGKKPETESITGGKRKEIKCKQATTDITEDEAYQHRRREL